MLKKISDAAIAVIIFVPAVLGLLVGLVVFSSRAGYVYADTLLERWAGDGAQKN